MTPQTLDDVLTMQEAMRLLGIPAGQNMRIYRLLRSEGLWTDSIGQTRIIERQPLETLAGARADVPSRPIPLAEIRIWRQAAAELGCSKEWLYVLSGWRPERNVEAELHPAELDGRIHLWMRSELDHYVRRRKLSRQRHGV